MRLNDLIETKYDIEIDFITDSSKEVFENTLFVCIKGEKYDGHDFVEEAINNGACAVLCEKELNLSIPTILVPNTKEILSKLLSKFYNNPSNKMKMIGVTGTDGKTSTALILKHILSKKYATGYIGTNGAIYKNNSFFTNNTTPGPTVLQPVLYDMLIEDIKMVCMEVSSHAIASKRIEGIDFDVAIFTNLSHEHLDHHKNIGDYFNTKLELFKSHDKSKLSVVNLDDAYSEELLSKTDCNYITYSVNKPSDFQATNIELFENYTRFDLLMRNEIVEDIKVNLFGEYNVYNALAAIIVSIYYRVSMDTIIRSLENIPQIEGRMQYIQKNPFSVIVDFAHTPNGLKNLLLNINKLNKNNIIIICGAAGNKDRSKRPLMGEIVTNLADFVIFTSEDPKNESLDDIFSDLTHNIKTENYVIISSRKDAIEHGLKVAKHGDIVLITGKGSEKFENIDDILYEHCDIDIAKNALDIRNV